MPPALEPVPESATDFVAAVHGALPELVDCLDTARIGLWSRSYVTGEVHWSPGLEELFGLQRGEFAGSHDAYIGFVHPDDRERVLADIQHAISTQGELRYEHRVIRVDGELRHVRGVGTPVLADDGTMVGMTGVCVDITDRHVADQRLQRMHLLIDQVQRVGQAVTSQLDLEQAVHVVTEAATELSGAQFGAFFYNVTGDDGEAYTLYTIAGVDSAHFDKFPMPRNTAVFAPTFEGRGTVRYDDVQARPEYGHNAPHHGMPQGHLPVRSYLAVPVRLRDGEVAGGLFFGHPDVGVFDEMHERLVEGIAAFAGIAIENSRLYDAARRELDARQRIADALLLPLVPRPLPHVPGLDVAAEYEPFQHALAAGGDLYGVLPLPDGRVLAFLADVSGKGPEAAALTGLVRQTIWTAAQLSSDPAWVLAVVDRALDELDDERFVTAVAVAVSPVSPGGVVELEIVAAGHPQPLVVGPAGTRLIAVEGSPLGLLSPAAVGRGTARLHPGERLVLYTDGLCDGHGCGIGDEALLELVEAAPRTTSAELAGTLVRRAADLRVPRDDCAVLVLGPEQTA